MTSPFLISADLLQSTTCPFDKVGSMLLPVTLNTGNTKLQTRTTTAAAVIREERVLSSALANAFFWPLGFGVCSFVLFSSMIWYSAFLNILSVISDKINTITLFCAHILLSGASALWGACPSGRRLLVCILYFLWWLQVNHKVWKIMK